MRIGKPGKSWAGASPSFDAKLCRHGNTGRRQRRVAATPIATAETPVDRGGPQ
ncbi:hypothetical protein GGQ96_001243 [Sphingomonas abaci]|uniref:Uncharacterized protein n=1 Tax=Sphingomonas abaci TaxID=237611 RepID=A0A7W7AHH9_9SPHN|nr:hypothetical protein [Sphingomonas abaci]